MSSARADETVPTAPTAPTPPVADPPEKEPAQEPAESVRSARDEDPPRDRVGIVLAVLATFVYVATSATHVLGGDNGEFITLFTEGGVAHPSGYPATVVWLRLWSWLPIDAPAQGAAVAVALLGGITVYGVWRACLNHRAHELGAGIATALYAFGAGAWIQSTHAEVFAMHAAVASGIVAVAGPRSRVTGATRVGVLAALAGIGLANNHTIVGLAPIGLYGVVIGIREAERTARAWAAGPFGLVIGSLVQLQLVFTGGAAGTRWAWGDTGSLDGLVHHLLRRDFGTFQLGIYEGGAGLPMRHIELLFGTVIEHYLYVGALVAVLGLIAVVREGRSGGEARDRWGLAMLGLAFVLVGPVLLSRFNLSPDGVARHVVERFHLLPALLVAPWVALGADRVIRPIAPRLPVIATAVAVAYVSIVARFDDVREHHRPTVEIYLRNVAGSVPSGSVLLGTGDHRLYGFLYVHRALGKMHDVTYVDVRMLLHPWYASRVQRELGGRPLDGIDHAERNIDTVALVRGLQQQGRPVYLTDVFSPQLAQQTQLVPWGVLFEVQAPGARPMSLVEVAERHQAVLQRYIIEPDPPHVDSWSALVHEDYARAWGALSEPLAAQGFVDAAETFEENARRVRPVAPDPFWR